MGKRRRFLLIAALFSGLICYSYSFTAYPIRVSNMVFELSLAPGESGTFSFEVLNNETRTTRITVYLVDWRIHPDGSQVFLDPGILPRSNTAWIVVSPSEFGLNPGETQEVRFTISVPENVEGGTYWGMIFVEGSPIVTESGGISILTVQRFGIKVYETTPEATLRDGRVTGMSLISLDPLKVKVAFENTGNASLRPEGRVEVMNEQGELVKRLEIGAFSVLPGANREVEVVDEGGKRLGPGRYVVLGIIDFGGENLVAGRLLFQITEN
ncbi:MAG: molecular chaperone [Candidatus Bipolaricaulia bacterium]